MSKGKFITFEGGEGTGKSTQIALLAEVLRNKKISVVTTREPGGAPNSEAIRELLIKGEVNCWSPKSETLLNFASRIEHLDKTIYPALAEGKHVISDRFADSTMAYQGYGHGVGHTELNTINEFALGDFKPDLTIIFDLDTEIGLKRAKARGEGEDRYERMSIEFHRKMRQGFLDIANSEPRRCQVVDASGTIEQVSDTIRNLVSKCLQVKLV